MKKYLLLLLPVILLFTGCYKDDIDDLKKQTEEHEARLKTLEEWQKSVNTNISALQSIVSALEEKDFVTSVEPIQEGGEEVGYKIYFTKRNPATIYHGKKGENGQDGKDGQNGQDGLTPKVGIELDDDNRYYWTIDNGDGTVNWLLDKNGEKVAVVGKNGEDGQDGQNGMTPKVRINTSTNEWEISADGSETGYISTGIKATGAKGNKGEKGEQGDSIFAPNGVDNSNEDYVIFTLADGITTIKLPKYRILGIDFTQPVIFAIGETIEIPYTITGIDPAIITAVNVPDGWKVAIDKTEQKIIVTAASQLTNDNSKAEIIILLADKNGQNVIKNMIVEADKLIYRVGDYYPDRNVKFSTAGVVQEGTMPEGIVFWLDPASDSKKGKIVSLDEVMGSNTNYPYLLSWNNHYNVLSIHTLATDENDGLKNRETMAAFLQSPQNTYSTTWDNLPQYKFARDKNEHQSAIDWYAPALYELQAIYSCYSGNSTYEPWEFKNPMPSYNSPECEASHQAFNKKLLQAGGKEFETVDDPFGTPVRRTTYWSSTEIDADWADENGFANYCAGHVHFGNGITSYSNKSNGFHVRVIAKFGY